MGRPKFKTDDTILTVTFKNVNIKYLILQKWAYFWAYFVLFGYQ